jgi:UDP-N-acetylmuramoyl-tripeptide--D-alanyl-D-alanine ligase
LHAGHEAVVLEMGTNIRGEIGRLTQIADPDIGVITNIGPAHLEGLKSLDGVAEEKGDLFLNMRKEGVVIVNRDDDAVRTLGDRWTGKKVAFGIERDALVRAEDITKTGKGETSFVLVIEGTRRRIKIRALGRHNIYNALAAAACSWELGVEYDQICRGVENFEQLSGRMRIYELKNGAHLVDDTYNANPASTMKAIETLVDLKGDNELVVIMGDMLELGEQSCEMHEKIGRFMAEKNVDRIFLQGELVQSLAVGAERGGMAKERIVFPANPQMVAVELSSSLRKGDWILAKGSRRMKMEEYAKAIIAVCGED